MSCGKWAIRNKESGRYLETSSLHTGYVPKIDRYRTKRDATADLKDSIHRSRWDQYEVVKYEPTDTSD